MTSCRVICVSSAVRNGEKGTDGVLFAAQSEQISLQLVLGFSPGMKCKQTGDTKAHSCTNQLKEKRIYMKFFENIENWLDFMDKKKQDE